MSKDIFSNLRFSPRPYQVSALESWQKYFVSHESQNSLRALFNMATGSGKTYLMATLILDLYSRGFNNFIFFVNSANILEKTRDNFINLGSSKYLFQPNIFLDNKPIFIREVKNFSNINLHDKNVINILFTTTQRLHSDLLNPHENRIAFSDFEKNNLVLIADEAHHNNARSTKTQSTKNSWEETIEKIITNNPKTILLEFTATMNFDQKNISEKYHNQLIFTYLLKDFCADKYSKNVFLFIADPSVERRMLSAMIISEFRRLIAEKNNIFLKPIIMFKSRTIFENQNNLKLFTHLLLNLTFDQIEIEKQEASGLLQSAFDFFERQGIPTDNLVKLLQNNFHPDYLLRVDGGRPLSLQDQNIINTLENPQNKFRAIFAVDMLKEGWDVLNLFDIVRLYDTLDKDFAKAGQPSKTTISEIQLIGRGARYCPLKINDKMSYARQFDNESENELRFLEQLHYHSPHNVQYITELKQALGEMGIVLYNN